MELFGSMHDGRRGHYMFAKSIVAFATSIARNAARASPAQIVIASSTSALIEAAGSASGSDEHSGAFTSGLALFIIRTKEELRVNGDPMGRGEGELTAAAIDHGRPHQVAVPARTVGSWKLSALLCRCVKRHHSVFHEDQWWIEAGKDVPATLLARAPRYSNT